MTGPKNSERYPATVPAARLAVVGLLAVVTLRLASRLGPASVVLGVLALAAIRTRRRDAEPARRYATSQAPSSPSAEMEPTA